MIQSLPLPYLQSLVACRQWINICACNLGPTLEAGAEALVAFVIYERERREWADRAEPAGGAHDMSAEQWQYHNFQMAMLARIPVTYRLMLVQAFTDGAVSEHDIRQFILTNMLPEFSGSVAPLPEVGTQSITAA